MEQIVVVVDVGIEDELPTTDDDHEVDDEGEVFAGDYFEADGSEGIGGFEEPQGVVVGQEVESGGGGLVVVGFGEGEGFGF